MEDNLQMRNQLFFCNFFQDGNALVQYKKKEVHHSIKTWACFKSGNLV